MNSKLKIKLIFIAVLISIIALAGFWFFKFGEKKIEISNPNQNKETQEDKNKEKNLSSLAGLECNNYNQRPIAVMLAEDPVTRPLSGISDADLVIEMPVITGSITRMMAVFQCKIPEEIGSIRSARHDFIPLALGLDAIYVHWGGSHFALDKLNQGIIDNLDALKDSYSVFFRKPDIVAPHNGFSSASRIINGAKKMKYRLEDSFSGYLHLENPQPKTTQSGRLVIGYGGPYRVYYDYDPQANIYRRWRADQREIDKNNGNQVEASAVVVMRAESRMIEPPNYNEVDIGGQGEASIYQNGEEIKGFWRKDEANPGSKLFFLDQNGTEIKFTPGKIWIEVVEPFQEVRWSLF